MTTEMLSDAKSSTTTQQADRFQPLIERYDKMSKSFRAHFWGSKLLMVTVRLSALHSAPAEPLPVVKVTNPRGRGVRDGERGC